MNKVIAIGRLTRDPDSRATQDGKEVAQFTVAVDRRVKKEGQPTADFIPCVAFGKTAEFISKYFHKGMKIVLTGRIQTGSYTNKDGQKVYTTDVVVEEAEFGESKRETQETAQPAPDGFVPFPEGEQEELPF